MVSAACHVQTLSPSTIRLLNERQRQLASISARCIERLYQSVDTRQVLIAQ